jgi:transposase
VLADKAYNADRIRELIQDQGATPNIPPKSNRRWKPCFSKRLYRERNLIERFFSKLKHFRRVATRYDKLAANFLAMIQLASMRLWLRAYESTALKTTYGNSKPIRKRGHLWSRSRRR